MNIPRNYYLNKLIEAKGDNLVKVITGIRRCGKSYLLDPIFKDYLISTGVDEKHIIKLELDKRENEKYRDPDVLNEYVNSQIKDDNVYYILLDEIQLVKDFESVLIGFLYNKNMDIYVTGSNSRFLSTDIVTEFRGRGEEIKVYPLSFSEFKIANTGENTKLLADYYMYGGLPLVSTMMNTSERKVNYLKEQLNNVYINDVIERNKIVNNKEIIYTLLEIISSSIGSLVNAKKISDTFKSNAGINIAPETITQYLKYLEEAFIIKTVKRYDVKGRKYINTPLKIYFTDVGIRNAVINFRQIENTHIMENIIFNELIARNYNVDVGMVYCREQQDGVQNYKQLEVDFIASKGYDKIYIQSAYSLPDDEKRNQEIKPFLKIQDSFKKIVITGDYTNMWKDDNGIITMNIFDFLGDIDSLKKA